MVMCSHPQPSAPEDLEQFLLRRVGLSLWEDPDEDVAYWISPVDVPDPEQAPWEWNEAEQKWVNP